MSKSKFRFNASYALDFDSISYREFPYDFTLVAQKLMDMVCCEENKPVHIEPKRNEKGIVVGIELRSNIGYQFHIFEIVLKREMGVSEEGKTFFRPWPSKLEPPENMPDRMAWSKAIADYLKKSVHSNGFKFRRRRDYLPMKDGTILLARRGFLAFLEEEIFRNRIKLPTMPTNLENWKKTKYTATKHAAREPNENSSAEIIDLSTHWTGVSLPTSDPAVAAQASAPSTENGSIRRPRNYMPSATVMRFDFRRASSPVANRTGRNAEVVRLSSQRAARSRPSL